MNELIEIEKFLKENGFKNFGKMGYKKVGLPCGKVYVFVEVHGILIDCDRFKETFRTAWEATEVLENLLDEGIEEKQKISEVEAYEKLCDNLSELFEDEVSKSLIESLTKTLCNGIIFEHLEEYQRCKTKQDIAAFWEKYL